MMRGGGRGGGAGRVLSVVGEAHGPSLWTCPCPGAAWTREEEEGQARQEVILGVAVPVLLWLWWTCGVREY